MKKTANAINMIFYKCYQSPLGQLLWQFENFYQSWGPVTWPLLEGWYKKNPQFSRFFENISASFWYLFVKSFLVARSFLVVVIHIKILITGAPVTLETRLKVSVLAVFWQFWSLFQLFVLAQAFSLGHWFFYEKSIQRIYFHV